MTVVAKFFPKVRAALRPKSIPNQIALALLAATAITTPAFATVYNFASTDIPGFGPSPTTTSFSLDTATATVISNGSQFNNVALTYDGVLYPGYSIATSFGTNLASSLFFFIDTSTTPLYSGVGPATVFNIGTFAIADGATDGIGTLTISASAVPEAATWAMMLVGLGVVGAEIRRRRFKTAAA